MIVTVRKPTEAEKAEMQSKPTWGCEVSEFEYFGKYFKIQPAKCIFFDGNSLRRQTT